MVLSLEERELHISRLLVGKVYKHLTEDVV